MIIKFKQSYSDQSKGNCIIMEQITGNVSAVIYQQKSYEVADMVTEELIFDISGKQYCFTKMKEVKIIMKDDDGKEKLYEISKSELTGKWEMNGSTYSSLKELYYDLKF